MSQSAETDALCEVMHDAYEKAAAESGWATQERSRVPWADVPEANKCAMRAAVRALLDHLSERENVHTCAGCSRPLHERPTLSGGVRLWTCDTASCPGNLARIGVTLPPGQV